MSCCRMRRRSRPPASGCALVSRRRCSRTSCRPCPRRGSTTAAPTSTISSCAWTMSNSPFSYAVYRLVPRLERGERVNVGVVVFCRPLDYLAARTFLDEARALALWPELDVAAVRPHLDAIERIAAGDSAGGPIAALDTTARFHWLVAPSSTIIQPSVVHTGLCGDPDEQLEKLFRSLVA